MSSDTSSEVSSLSAEDSWETAALLSSAEVISFPEEVVCSSPPQEANEEDLRLDLNLTAKVTLKQAGEQVAVPVYQEEQS